VGKWNEEVRNWEGEANSELGMRNSERAIKKALGNWEGEKLGRCEKMKGAEVGMNPNNKKITTNIGPADSDTAKIQFTTFILHAPAFHTQLTPAKPG
jgi:hypothetical protein